MSHVPTVLKSDRSVFDKMLPVDDNGDFQQCGMCDKQRLRPACACAQSDQSLCLSLEYSMTVKLLTEQHLEFLSLKGFTGSSESTLVKMSHCWKSHVSAQIVWTHMSLLCREQSDLSP